MREEKAEAGRERRQESLNRMKSGRKFTYMISLLFQLYDCQSSITIGKSYRSNNFGYLQFHLSLVASQVLRQSLSIDLRLLVPMGVAGDQRAGLGYHPVEETLREMGDDNTPSFDL